MCVCRRGLAEAVRYSGGTPGCYSDASFFSMRRRRRREASKEGRECSMGESKGVIRALSEGREHLCDCAPVRKYLIHGKIQLNKVLNEHSFVKKTRNILFFVC